MPLNFNCPVRHAGKFVGLALAITFLLSSTLLLAQTTISTGSIQGTVTDPSGAVVSGAKISITNKSTGRVINASSNSVGAYSSGALAPGDYVLRAEATGFKTTEVPVTVQVGVTTAGNLSMQVGQTSQVVEVQGSEVQVNTQQAEVQGVINTEQIENLPVNGRNFLDLAQLEPGVQIQDGTNFDPTKVGYSSISFGGRFGRTARIEVDGVDVSDETVGTTTEDIPASAIEEFQLSQSKLDLSNELTSSGAVNVTTRSGSNQFHGEGFEYFRDSSVAAALPAPEGLSAPFSRNQFGARVGGPVIKDKAFFFLDAERTLNNLSAPVSLPAPFTALSGDFPSPFREFEFNGRFDYQLTKNAHAFYRFNYFDNSAFNTFFASSFQVYDNKDDTRSHVVGVDFNTGSLTHSVRFEYLKFQNQIANAAVSVPNSNLGISIFNGPLAVGPNFLAPQSTPQSDHQIKYDGSKSLGNHIIRFGATYNHIQGGGYASFFSIAPTVTSNPTLYNAALCGACPGGPANPLNYPVQAITLGNGQGFSTTNPAFGFPAGGLGPDNRIGFYLGDSWRVRHNLVVEGGLRYNRDTGRTDSDLPGIPALNGLLPYFPNLGAPIKQPNLNLAPQLGVSWDPKGSGKTVVRAGIGLYFENVIWNNVLFDRPTREAEGAFLQTASPCNAPGTINPNGIPVTPSSAFPNGVIPVPANICAVGTSTTPITVGAAAANIADLQTLYQANSPFKVLPNPGYIPTLLAQGIGLGTNPAPLTFGPNYQSPRSVQMNFGIQHEIRRGLVFTTDFVRNVETHFLLGQDLNHTGDVSYFNLAGAQEAINATNASFGCGAGSAGIPCAIAKGATMASYATDGLTTTAELGAHNCPAAGCAFPGVNKTVSNLNFLEPIGRSTYNGLDMKLVENVNNPVRGIKRANFQIAYSLSRFDNPGGANPTAAPSNPVQSQDQDFVIGSPDNANPNRYFGPSTLDRTHQISFGGNFEVPAGFRLGIISHFYSPLAEPLIVSNSGLGNGEIFRTDFTGDGTTQDPMPGTKTGAFGRSVSASGLGALINNYNQTFGGEPTPAGQVLVSNGLFSVAQLQALQGVAPFISAPPQGQVGLAWLRAFDLTLAWHHTFRERYTIEPSASLFNIFNFANFDLPPNILNPYLGVYYGTTPTPGAQGSINGTTYAQQQNVRVGAGTGVFGQGSPRVAEFGMKLSF